MFTLPAELLRPRRRNSNFLQTLPLFLEFYYRKLEPSALLAEISMCLYKRPQEHEVVEYFLV